MSYEEFLAQVGVDAIPSYLFTAPDASAHIFDFLRDPVYQTFSGWETSGGSVLNWTDWRFSPGVALLGYGPFLGCLLYPNVTRNIRDGSLPSNLTDIGFPSSNETADPVSRYLRSMYATCLGAYCTSQPDCAATSVCDVGSLLTDSYELSAQGVGTCWQTLCSLDVQIVNPDIAGIGILMSYLIQSIIALLALCSLAILAVLVYRYDRKAASASENLRSAKHHTLKLARARRHWEVTNAILAGFQKAQCYLTIALQIASFVVIFSNLVSTSYNDQNLLLLVSLDGLIPVVLGLYTLMTFGKKSWYMITLSVISVALASASGCYISLKVLLPQASQSDVQTINVAGGTWPAVCGGTGPEGVCNGIGPNAVGFDDDSSAFLAMMAVLDAITVLLVLWKISTESTIAWSTASGWLANRLTGQQKSREHNLHRIQYVTRIFFHFLVASSILGCLAVELYFFDQIFTSSLVDFTSWGFGQIVGITVWAGIFIEAAYLEYFGVDEGLDWRFPRWLHVRDNSHDESTTTPPPRNSHADETNSSTNSTRDLPDKLVVSASSTATWTETGSDTGTRTGTGTGIQTTVVNTRPVYSRTLNLDLRGTGGYSDPQRQSTAPDEP